MINQNHMKYILILLLLFKCSISDGQITKLDTLLSMYKMNIGQLKEYSSKLNVTIHTLRNYRNSATIISGKDSQSNILFMRLFPDDSTHDYIPTLGYHVYNKEEYERIKQLIIDKGYKITPSNTSLEEYKLGESDIQISLIQEHYIISISND